MSKMTLGQRKLPTLGQRSTLPKSYIGPTLSCYLGYQGQNDISQKLAERPETVGGYFFSLKTYFMVNQLDN